MESRKRRSIRSAYTGGCNTCKGAITVESTSSYTRNVAYYIIAHASKFVTPGSARVNSNNAGNLNSVAFKTPEGKKVAIIENDGNATEIFNLKTYSGSVVVSLEAGSVGTFVW